jgi:hypothetical protein
VALALRWEGAAGPSLLTLDEDGPCGPRVSLLAKNVTTVSCGEAEAVSRLQVAEVGDCPREGGLFQ